MTNTTQIQHKFGLLKVIFNERQRRLWAAAEALALGRGGITRVAAATGLSPKTIRAGVQELRGLEAGSGEILDPTKVRQPGAGRPSRTEQDPTLVRDLEALLEPKDSGPAPVLLRWTCLTTAALSSKLQKQGHAISPRKVAQLLHELGYDLRSRGKPRGRAAPDRNAQFSRINARAGDFLRRGQPVVGLDIRKQHATGAQAGDSGGGGQGGPVGIGPPHFPNFDVGRSLLSGSEEHPADASWLSVSVDQDTAEFVLESLRHWWRQFGSQTSPGATELLIVANVGDISGDDRLWPVGLQRLADEFRLRIGISHFPSATTRWERIRHRLLSVTSTTGPEGPVAGHGIVVNLIGGPPVSAESESPAAGLQALTRGSDEESGEIPVQRAEVDSAWNLTITPRTAAPASPKDGASESSE
jgi:hypothetical protein